MVHYDLTPDELDALAQHAATQMSPLLSMTVRRLISEVQHQRQESEVQRQRQESRVLDQPHEHQEEESLKEAPHKKMKQDEIEYAKRGASVYAVGRSQREWTDAAELRAAFEAGFRSACAYLRAR